MLDGLTLSDERRSFLQAAAEKYNSLIDPPTASYLTGRGLDKDAANGHLLGVVSDPVPGHERFAGMLSIPYVSNAGVLGFKFRCMTPHDCKHMGHPKYDSPTGQHARLFNVRALTSNTDVVCLVEGEMAAIVWQHHLDIPTVGTPGTQWVKEHPHWGRCFSDFERVIVVADHDLTDEGRTDPGKGVGHAKRVVSTLPNADLVLPPPGMDPDEWLVNDGLDVIRKVCGL